jgi:hypothetical protein
VNVTKDRASKPEGIPSITESGSDELTRCITGLSQMAQSQERPDPLPGTCYPPSRQTWPHGTARPVYGGPGMGRLTVAPVEAAMPHFAPKSLIRREEPCLNITGRTGQHASAGGLYASIAVGRHAYRWR